MSPWLTPQLRRLVAHAEVERAVAACDLAWARSPDDAVDVAESADLAAWFSGANTDPIHSVDPRRDHVLSNVHGPTPDARPSAGAGPGHPT
jgi:hypothetical protein